MLKQIVLFLCLIVASSAISQSTLSVINGDTFALVPIWEIEQAGLIFLEHEKMSLQIPLLMEAIDIQKAMNGIYIEKNLEHLTALGACDETIQFYIDQEASFKKQMRKQKIKYYITTAAGVIIIILLL